MKVQRWQPRCPPRRFAADARSACAMLAYEPASMLASRKKTQNGHGLRHNKNKTVLIVQSLLAAQEPIEIYAAAIKPSSNPAAAAAVAAAAAALAEAAAAAAEDSKSS